MYLVLRKLLDKIEESPAGESLCADGLARSLGVSPSHLRWLFRTSFGAPLSSYARSRRLARSLESLFSAKATVADVAAEHGFGHARTYTRAFRAEFGLAPGEAREAGRILRVRPPLQLFPVGEFADGSLFGPEIVHVPEIRCVGRRHALPRDVAAKTLAAAGLDFWHYDRNKVEGSGVFISLSKFAEGGDSVAFAPSMQVADFSRVPRGFEASVIPPCLCARFTYVGPHSWDDLNYDTASAMFDRIAAFERDQNIKLGLGKGGIQFERIIPLAYGEGCCGMEWYSPVCDKRQRPEGSGGAWLPMREGRAG